MVVILRPLRHRDKPCSPKPVRSDAKAINTIKTLDLGTMTWLEAPLHLRKTERRDGALLVWFVVFVG